MSAAPSALPVRAPRRAGDRIADLLFHGLTLVPALAALAVVVAIGWKVADGSRLAFHKFGLGFVTTAAWDPVKGVFGARDFILGTALTSAIALVLATIGTTMIVSTTAAVSNPVPADGMSPLKNGVQPSALFSTGSRCCARNGPSTRIPHKPTTTLGIAASSSTSAPITSRMPRGASSLR